MVPALTRHPKKARKDRLRKEETIEAKSRREHIKRDELIGVWSISIEGAT